MAQVAGYESRVEWAPTFRFVLLIQFSQFRSGPLHNLHLARPGE
jgi:hypothetical protein